MYYVQKIHHVFPLMRQSFVFAFALFSPDIRLVLELTLGAGANPENWILECRLSWAPYDLFDSANLPVHLIESNWRIFPRNTLNSLHCSTGALCPASSNHFNSMSIMIIISKYSFFQFRIQRYRSIAYSM